MLKPETRWETNILGYAASYVLVQGKAHYEMLYSDFGRLNYNLYEFCCNLASTQGLTYNGIPVHLHD
jgi:hypothetical protein